MQGDRFSIPVVVDDQKDIQDTLKDITGELLVLEARYRRLVNLVGFSEIV